MGSEANRKHFRQCFQKCVSNFRSLWLSIRAMEGVPPVIVLWQGLQVCRHFDTSWICLCLTEFFCFGGCDMYALPGQLSASLGKLSTEVLSNCPVILFPVSHSRGKSSFSIGITNTFLLGILTDKFATFLYVLVFHWWTSIPSTESQASPQMFNFETSSILSDVSVEVYLLLSRSLAAGYWAGSIWIYLGLFLFCF